MGQIIEALKETEKLENTIVVFTSDNGPWSMFTEYSGIARPLRGPEINDLGRGTRVPFIVSSTVVESQEYHGLMTHYDIYATLATLAGVTVPEGQAIDSLDMSKVWLEGAEPYQT